MKSQNLEPKSVLFNSFLKTRMELDLISSHPIQTPRRRIANLKYYLKSNSPSESFAKVQKIVFRKSFLRNFPPAVEK
jgi:hypothetical protein